jgi:hypothetical protein
MNLNQVSTLRMIFINTGNGTEHLLSARRATLLYEQSPGYGVLMIADNPICTITRSYRKFFLFLLELIA